MVKFKEFRGTIEGTCKKPNKKVVEALSFMTDTLKDFLYSLLLLFLIHMIRSIGIIVVHMEI